MGRARATAFMLAGLLLALVVGCGDGTSVGPTPPGTGGSSSAPPPPSPTATPTPPSASPAPTATPSPSPSPAVAASPAPTSSPAASHPPTPPPAARVVREVRVSANTDRLAFPFDNAFEPAVATHPSFKPTVAARDGVVFVGFHVITDVRGGIAPARRPVIATYFAVSVDGGRTYGRPAPVTRTRWRAAALERGVNGPGLRERADFTADGHVFYVYGDGRRAAPAPSRAWGRGAIYGALVFPGAA